jgi:hypothetical protein
MSNLSKRKEESESLVLAQAQKRTCGHQSQEEVEITSCLDRILRRLEIFESKAEDLGFLNNASICTPENEKLARDQSIYHMFAQSERFTSMKEKFIAYLMWADRPSMAEEEGFDTKSAQIVAYSLFFGTVTPEVLEEINQKASMAEADIGEWV